MGLCSAMRMLLLLSWPISSLSRCLHFTCERFLKKKKIPAWGMFGTYQICHYYCLSIRLFVTKKRLPVTTGHLQLDIYNYVVTCFTKPS